MKKTTDPLDVLFCTGAELKRKLASGELRTMLPHDSSNVAADYLARHLRTLRKRKTKIDSAIANTEAALKKISA